MEPLCRGGDGLGIAGALLGLLLEEEVEEVDHGPAQLGAGDDGVEVLQVRHPQGFAFSQATTIVV